ncbi:hypothetical protein [Butyrivibrio sp. AE2032]|uniref:hypothetical protein n=1 Tax=Butyrivibrio sp. AE2032 TaxID=1458463 RepID=UPI00068AD1A1|nr:hypothetical protein [Butyrivibrio sp. AE2032]
MSIAEYISDELAEVYIEDGFDRGLDKGLKEGHKEGLKEGHKEGRQDTNTLFTWLFDLDRVEDVKKAATDPNVMDALIQEYNECHDDKLT